jgi:Uma2 family endonuclease
MTPPVRSANDLDPTKTYTYADYLTWQLGEWVELLRGKLTRRMSPAPADLHQAIVGELHLLIGNYLHRKPCKVRVAPYDVRLFTNGPNAADSTITTVVQPDICVICDPIKIDKRGCNGAPDWIIEVLSPGTFSRDTRDKFDLYEEAGVGEYWLVAPAEQSITAYVLDPATGRYRLSGEYGEPGPISSHTLPELAMTWEDVFPEEASPAKP